MTIDKASLEEVTGYLGIGALELLAAFFIIDGYSNFFELVEWYSKTSSWAILFTVPGIVIAYVLGVVSVATFEIFIPVPVVLTPEVFAQAVKSKSEPLLRRYSEVERVARLLNGASLAFLLIAVGLLAEVRMLGRFGFVGYVGAFCAVVLTCLCPFVSHKLQSRFLPYLRAVCRQ